MKKNTFCLIFLIFGILGFKSTWAQNMQKPSLNHIAIYIHDLKTSTAFYKDVIGLEIIPEPFHDGRHTWFTLGAAGQLHLISGAAADLPHDKNAHLCFSVDAVEDFIANLNKNQIDFSNWKGDSRLPTVRPDGVKQIYFQDPDGYWIEINNDKLK